MKVRVFGSMNQDLVAYVETLPTPGETTLGEFSKFPGGKGANQAIAAAKGGAQVEMFGATGNDDAGNFMLEVLKEASVDITGVEKLPYATGVALIIVDARSENMIAVCPGANLRASASGSYDNFEGVALAQGETSQEQTEAFILGMNECGATTVVNPAPYGSISRKVLGEVDYLILNEVELAQHSDSSVVIESREDAIAAIKQIPNENTIVTLGRNGVVARFSNEIFEIDSHNVDAVDTVGAGDCFCGYFASQLAKKKEPLEALRIANKAASISVTRKGAASSMPRIEEVEVGSGG